MVQTRRQWREWRDHGFQEDRNEAYDHDTAYHYNGNVETERRFHIGHAHEHPGPYNDYDEHHRHRKPDDQEKTETVKTYKRRKSLS